MNKQSSKRLIQMGFNDDVLKNGVPTKEFKKFATDMKGKLPMPNNYFFNPITKRLNKKNSIFKKDGDLRKKFDDYFLMRNKKYGYQYMKPIKQHVVDDSFSITITSKKKLNEESLLNQIIYKNKLWGKYRLLTLIDDVLVDDNTWDMTKLLLKGDLWNHYVYPDLMWSTATKKAQFIFSKYYEIKKEKIEQVFLDGVNHHCFFHPMLSWAKDMRDNTKSSSTKKKYDILVNNIEGKMLKNGYKDGLLQKYKNGVPETDIQEVCDKLQVGVSISQPFSKEPLLECTSQKMPRKVFKFVNTRLNHVELEGNHKLDKLYCDDIANATVLNIMQLREKKKELEEKKIDFIMGRNIHGINSLKTIDHVFTLSNDYQDTVNDFERSTGIYDCKIDALKNHELTNFIINATHFNGTVDFQDVSNVDHDEVEHIDMTKAYTQFKSSKYYDGFLGKITDFRQCNKIMGKGLYRIIDIDMTKADSKFSIYNDTLKWFIDGNIYTDAELKMAADYGMTFSVTHGCYGTKVDFEFNEKMTNEKEIVGFRDGKYIKVPYYSKWTGGISRIALYKNFYMNGDEKFFRNLRGVHSIKYDKKNGEAEVSFRKSYVYHARHIAAQIVAYQRMVMLEQLMNMDSSKILRICVDGIYYQHHSFDMHKSFSEKEKMTFANAECERYLSGIITKDPVLILGNKYLPTAPVREHHMKELFIGGGGCGKTYTNLVDKGFVNTVFIAPSWKLASCKKEEFGIDVNVMHRLCHQPYSEKLLRRYSVYIIDEASMITEKTKQFLFNNCKGKLIFCGDIGYQLPPVCSSYTYTINNESFGSCSEVSKYLKELGVKCTCVGLERQFKGKMKLVVEDITILKHQGTPDKEMNKKGFDNVVKMKTNYRSKGCPALLKLLGKLRKNIYNQKYIDKIKNKLQKGNLSNYSAYDMIICSEHKYKDEYTERFKELEKYRITDNSRDYCNGEIVYKKPNVKCELQHGYTIHSVQGETCVGNLYIDMRGMKSMKMLYTAISRSKSIDKIFIL